MAWEIFTRKVVRTGTPAISVSSLGKIVLNNSATDILKKNEVEAVLLLWDSGERRIGIQKVLKTDTRSYKVGYSKRGGSAAFSAKTFFDYIGYDRPHTQSYAAVWNPGENILEFQLVRGTTSKHATKKHRLVRKKRLKS